MPLDAAHAAGQLQEQTRMPGRRLEQTGQSRLQIRRAADVRLGVGIGAVESKDRSSLRQLGQRGFGVSRIESESLRLTPEQALLNQRLAMVVATMSSEASGRLRKSRSLPMAVTFISISARLPAMVTSSTAWVSAPFSIHWPVAPRE